MARSQSTPATPAAQLAARVLVLSERVQFGRRPRRATVRELGSGALHLALRVRELEADNAQLRREVEYYRAASDAALDAWLLELDQQ